MLVWDSMHLLYGERWYREQGPDPTPLWLELLENVSDSQCVKAFTHLRDKRKETWPPNVVEFKQIVMPPSVGVRYLGTPLAEGAIDKLLPSPEQLTTAVPTRNFYLAKMRRTLKMPPKEGDEAASTLEAVEAQCRCHLIPDGAPEGTQCAACAEWAKRMMNIARGQAV